MEVNDPRTVADFQKTDALQSFGKLAQRLCYAAIITSGVALLLEFMLQV
jgi:hypothetical protein